MYYPFILSAVVLTALSLSGFCYLLFWQRRKKKSEMMFVVLGSELSKQSQITFGENSAKRQTKSIENTNVVDDKCKEIEVQLKEQNKKIFNLDKELAIKEAVIAELQSEIVSNANNFESIKTELTECKQVLEKLELAFGKEAVENAVKNAGFVEFETEVVEEKQVLTDNSNLIGYDFELEIAEQNHSEAPVCQPVQQSTDFVFEGFADQEGFSDQENFSDTGSQLCDYTFSTLSEEPVKQNANLQPEPIKQQFIEYNVPPESSHPMLNAQANKIELEESLQSFDEAKIFYPEDDLTKIRGVGSAFKRKLNEMGITTYRQIATWDETNLAEISTKFTKYKKRNRCQNWIEAAREAHYLKYGERL